MLYKYGGYSDQNFSANKQKACSFKVCSCSCYECSNTLLDLKSKVVARASVLTFLQ